MLISTLLKKRDKKIAHLARQKALSEVMAIMDEAIQAACCEANSSTARSIYYRIKSLYEPFY